MKNEAMSFGREDSGPQLRVAKEVGRDDTGRPVSHSIRVHTGSRKALQVK